MLEASKCRAQLMGAITTAPTMSYAVTYCDSSASPKLFCASSASARALSHLNSISCSYAPQMCSNTRDSSFVLSRRMTRKKAHNKHRHLAFVVFDLR